jgi:hypothetical protein
MASSNEFTNYSGGPRHAPGANVDQNPDWFKNSQGAVGRISVDSTDTKGTGSLLSGPKKPKKGAGPGGPSALPGPGSPLNLGSISDNIAAFKRSRQPGNSGDEQNPSNPDQPDEQPEPEYQTAKRPFDYTQLRNWPNLDHPMFGGGSETPNERPASTGNLGDPDNPAPLTARIRASMVGTPDFFAE